MENKETKQIEIEDEQIELIKSHLFESLEVLKNLEVKREIRLFGTCNECNKRCTTKNLRKFKNQFLCYHCWRSNQKNIIKIGSESQIDIKDIINPPKILFNNTKQPIIVNPEPIIQDSVVENITIDLLEGLTDEQKNLIKSLSERFKDVKNFCPLAFTVDIQTGDVYYFNNLVSYTKPMEQIK